MTPAHAGDTDWTPDMIAKLPKDRVEKVKKDCAARYPTDYSLQVVCEDTEFEALQTLIDRGVIKPQGDH
jgi:hypothetical protein